MSVAVSPAHAASAAPATPLLGVPAVRLIPPGHSARIIDALVGVALVYRLAVPGIPVPIPQLAMAALIGIALFRRPTRSFATAWWYPVTMPLLLLFLAAETWLNGIDPVRRTANIAVLMLFAGLMATGRIDVGSVIKGLGLGLVVNFVLFYAGVAPDSYAGKLTGYLQDKNAGALIYAVAAILCLLITKRLWLRLLILAGGAVAVVASDSRTTIAAYGVALVFLFVSTWMQRGFQLLTLLGCVLAFLYADDNLSRIGEYALDRKGSDALRMNIDFAASLKAQAAPWYGSGLGESTVELDSGTWFFHNSYDALIVEGGVVLLIVTIAVYLVTGLGLSNRGFVDAMRLDARAVAAATLVIFLCAVRLGEVFYAPIGFVVLGVGLARLLIPIDSVKQWWTS